MKVDYHLITETPGQKASQEQLVRLYHRYHFAFDYAASKNVLEVACGSGIGLGYLASKANQVIGGDIDEKNMSIAVKLYKEIKNIEILFLDAHNLNFPDGSFDVVLLFEAIYYLKDTERFFKEAFRVLRPHGVLIICTVNKDWVEFHPSPFTYRYYSVPELNTLLKRHFNSLEFYGAFSTASKGVIGKTVSLLKRIATRFNLIPGSLAARAYLKRIFIGPLHPLPPQIKEGMCEYIPPVKIASDKQTVDYKIIYAVAKKR